MRSGGISAVGETLLNDPAVYAQPGIMLLAATGDDRLDPSLANLLAVFVMVVAAIGVERIGTLGRVPVGWFASRRPGTRSFFTSGHRPHLNHRPRTQVGKGLTDEDEADDHPFSLES